MIGEYLGEGCVFSLLSPPPDSPFQFNPNGSTHRFSDEENIAIMHAFVDQIELRNMPFVDALRAFLQAFRLPGEAQKIDRFMLKFAERYIEGNANTPFANAGASPPSLSPL